MRAFYVAYPEILQALSAQLGAAPDSLSFTRVKDDPTSVSPSYGVLQCWLDEDQLRPGLPWQPLLENQIGAIRSAAVCVGANGVGPWHDMEMHAFLSEFANRGCPVIPVIPPSAAIVPALPLFLKQMMWVDMRQKEDGIRRLAWAITGKRPG